MKRQLEINKDYGSIFGLESEEGQHFIYLGDNVWLARSPKGERKITSEKQTAQVLEYINKPIVMVGNFR